MQVTCYTYYFVNNPGYAANLRLTVQNITEDQWVEMLKTRKGMPPMPWAEVNMINERDSRAIYAYIKSVGPKRERVPVAIGPGQKPATPYLNLFPQNLPSEAQPPVSGSN